jgi:hypothetical protein
MEGRQRSYMKLQETKKGGRRRRKRNWLIVNDKVRGEAHPK